VANLTGNARVSYVREMFSQIAPRYDLMNRVMTFGQDMRWRSLVIRKAAIPAAGILLDLGTGTGDLAVEALQQVDCTAVAADFTLEMMLAGLKRHSTYEGKRILPAWCAADAESLPFPDKTFDAVVSGFLMRNVVYVDMSLSEQHRVLKPGGRIVILDTTPPPERFIAPLIRFHMHTVVPALGELIAGNSEAYTYLPESTEQFLEPEMLARRLITAGFLGVGFQRLMFGTVAVHWGTK
jgi:demethylmenaquinone methyltransferase/2-methoxy-6-polyprenyl-1,4-benzoquinol methylase